MYEHNDESVYCRFVIDRIDELEDIIVDGIIRKGEYIVTSQIHERQVLLGQLWEISEPAIQEAFTVKNGILYA